jgi:hypothetical protein
MRRYDHCQLGVGDERRVAPRTAVAREGLIGTGLQLPSALTEPLSWIGLTWPEADEEQLLQAGQEWISCATDLRRTAEQANRAAAAVWQRGEGPAVEAFRVWWSRTDGPQRRLDEDAVASEIIGAALIAFAIAIATLAMKVAFIVQLTILAIEVAQAIATAFVTFGATTAGLPRCFWTLDCWAWWLRGC